MEASHSINVDPSTSTVTITVTGFFDQPALMRLVADREEAYKKLRCPPNQHVTLCDVSDCALQSQDMVAGFRQMIADPRRRSRRLAFVVGSSLARMQIRRMIAGRDDVLCFVDRNEAAAWLREPDGAARAA
jgi:hypothetical protein